jgi:hypothetical protein
VKLDKTLLHKVAVTGELAFTKTNIQHFITFDLKVQDPLDLKKARAQLNVGYRGASKRGYTWGAAAHVMVNGLAAGRFRAVSLLSPSMVSHILFAFAIDRFTHSLCFRHRSFHTFSLLLPSMVSR